MPVHSDRSPPDHAGRWRPARPGDDATLVALSRALEREDPEPSPGDGRRTRETLATLRREPWRGRAVALEVGGRVVGHALLVAFWSNHLGGEVCEVDELYVRPRLRGRGHGAALFGAIERGELWSPPPVAIALGVTPANTRARRLYERLGFIAAGTTMVKGLPRRRSRGEARPAGAGLAHRPATAR